MSVVARLRSSGGTRSGIQLAAATAVWTAGSALYSLICIRFLGSERFGDVATMAALGTVIAIPLGSVQSLLAREAAHLATQGAQAAVGALFWRYLRSGLLWSILLTAILVGASGPISRLTSVGSFVVVGIGLAVVPIYVVNAVINGFLQGLQRFGGLSLQVLLSGMARPVVAIPIFLAGFGAGGALGANVIASAFATLLGLIYLRDLPRGSGEPAHAPFQRREALILLGGTLAIASLTNLDVVLANSVLNDHEGGVYAAASLAAKLVLFFPAVVSTVLLPKATSRAAAGRSSLRILRLSVAVTGVVSLIVAGLMQIIPRDRVVQVFGPEFSEAAPLLGLFGVAMACMGMLNVLLFYHLAYRRPGFSLLLGCTAVAQIVSILAWHPSPRAIVLINLGCGLMALAAHELLFDTAMARSLSRREGGSAEQGAPLAAALGSAPEIGRVTDDGEHP